MRSVDAVIANKLADPKWRGDDSSAGGRPRALSDQQPNELVDLVFAERGKARVTISYCRRRLPSLRTVSKEAVRQELLCAGAFVLMSDTPNIQKPCRQPRLCA